MGYIEDFITQEMNMKYNNLTGKYETRKEKEYIFENDGELIEKYIEVLWYANHPLYPYQFKLMANIMRRIEKNISDDIIDDLKSLPDKDLIIKYNLHPHKVSMKYYNVEIENIKKSEKTDLLYKRNMFWNSYKENIKRWGKQYE